MAKEFQRRSLELTSEQWQNLESLAEGAQTVPPAGTTAGTPSWRSFVKELTAGSEFSPTQQWCNVWMSCPGDASGAELCRSLENPVFDIYIRRMTVADMVLHIATDRTGDLFVPVDSRENATHEWLFPGENIFDDDYDRMYFRRGRLVVT